MGNHESQRVAHWEVKATPYENKNATITDRAKVRGLAGLPSGIPYVSV